MNKLREDMQNMTEDVKEGMGKVGHVVKHTAKDLKDDAMGAMATMEMKRDEMMEQYEQKKFSKEIKKQMEREGK